ncbi:MAG: hypothetical protein AAGA96_06285 [Verrucomicrobiota bacterium]
MAILRSSDGKFYDVADDQLDDRLIPAEEIKERLGDAGVAPAQGPVGPGPEMVVPGSGGQVVIQVYTSTAGSSCSPPPSEVDTAVEAGDVEAHGWCWRRNYFSNCWRRNCWRNHCW